MRHGPSRVPLWAIATFIGLPEPADVFGGEVARSLLVAYCRHQATADTLSALLNQFEPAWLNVNRHGILPPERRRTLTPRLGEERDPARRSGAGGGDGPGPAPVRR